MTKEKSPLETILGTKTSAQGCSWTTVSCLSTLGIVPLPRFASLAGRYILYFFHTVRIMIFSLKDSYLRNRIMTIRNELCGMTSLYAVTYMYSINSSYDSFVPVKDATARNDADLFINL